MKEFNHWFVNAKVTGVEEFSTTFELELDKNITKEEVIESLKKKWYNNPLITFDVELRG